MYQIRNILTLLLLSTALFGQDVSDLLVEAEHNNPAIQAAKQQIHAAEAVPSQAGSWPDPMISYGRWLESVQTRVGPQEHIFMASQKIPFPGKLGLKKDIAQNKIAIVQEKLSAAIRDLHFQVRKTYAKLYQLDQSIEIVAGYREQLDALEMATRAKYESGRGNAVRFLRVTMEKTKVETKLHKLNADREAVQARILALLSRPAEGQITTSDQLSYHDRAAVAAIVDSLAVTARQEIRMQKQKVEIAERQEQLARKEYWPDFTLSGTYITIPNGAGMQTGENPYSVSVGINLPIQFGRRRAQVREAQAQKQAERFTLENLQNDIEAQLQASRARMQADDVTVQLYESDLLEQAESQLGAALSGYTNGTVEFNDLIEAYKLFLDLQLDYIAAQTDYAVQQAEFIRQAGGLLVE